MLKLDDELFFLFYKFFLEEFIELDFFKFYFPLTFLLFIELVDLDFDADLFLILLTEFSDLKDLFFYI